MDGVQTFPGQGGDSSQEAVPTAISDEPSVRRRRRRRRNTLGAKLRRNHKVVRVKRIIAMVFLGAVVIAASIYAARSSTNYEPVPSFGGP